MTAFIWFHCKPHWWFCTRHRDNLSHLAFYNCVAIFSTAISAP